MAEARPVERGLESSTRAPISASIRAVARSTSSWPATEMTTFTLRPSTGEGTRLTSPRSSALSMAKAAAEVDVVVDYLWGEPATIAIMALLEARADRSRAMDWVQIGAMAAAIQLPSVALRSANFRLQGNGQGAVSTAACVAELPSLVDEIDAGGIKVNTHEVPLADVEATWSAPEIPGVRTVLIP